MKKFAFTLAEIMIVLTIIAIITAILLPSARNATPDESLMKFKKTNMSLASAIQELVNSDKYYSNGDLGLKPNGSLVDDPKYFCNTLADVLSVKSLNCSDKNTGYNSSAVANFSDILTNEIDGEKIYEYADCMCNTTNLIPDEAEIILSDNTSIYTINPYYHFGSKTETGSSEEKRLFNLCSKEKRYKFICLDIDGLNQGEPPFGYALRADGKIVYGAKASAWIKASLQKKDDTEISFATASSCSPSGLTITPENDTCKRETTPSVPSPSPTPDPDPDPTCELSEHCTECDPATNLCITCEDRYKLVDGGCIAKTPCEDVDCGELAMCIELSETKGICMTKYNIGDKTELPIPSTVEILTADGNDSSEQEAKCWKGTTSNSCDSANGNYSGCGRTVCNLKAATEICSKLTYNGLIWSVITEEQITSLVNLGPEAISKGLGNNGLQLCDKNSGYSSSSCSTSTMCFGSFFKVCYPYQIVGETQSGFVYLLELSSGVFNAFDSHYAVAGSVRCISEL